MARIDVSTSVEIDDEGLDKAIIQAAAENLLEQTSLSARYGGKVIEIIEEKLSKIVAMRIEQMLDREITQVDRYGDVVPGVKKTFRDVFADKAEAFLTDRVNSDGSVAPSGYHTKARLEYLIGQVGASQYEAECRTIASKFKAELKELATQAISRTVAGYMAK